MNETCTPLCVSECSVPAIHLQAGEVKDRVRERARKDVLASACCYQKPKEQRTQQRTDGLTKKAQISIIEDFSASVPVCAFVSSYFALMILFQSKKKLPIVFKVEINLSRCLNAFPKFMKTVPSCQSSVQ